MRRHPYCVVLFDEIEKAHHDVFHVLLQVLDDGRLTDGQGRTIDFKNTIIIMTSNIGSAIIQEYADRGDLSEEATAQMEVRVRAEMKGQFRPEFLNRVDDSIVFHNLTQEELVTIVDIQLERVRKRLADRELRLELDESAKSYLAREGYDPHFGARPLKRAIQQHLLDPVALRLLDGTFAAGDEIRVSAGDSGLQLEKS